MPGAAVSPHPVRNVEVPPGVKMPQLPMAPGNRFNINEHLGNCPAWPVLCTGPGQSVGRLVFATIQREGGEKSSDVASVAKRSGIEKLSFRVTDPATIQER